MSFKRIHKPFIIVALAGLLGLALIAVLGKVSERSERRDQVYAEMAQVTAGSQIIIGPILIFPYELRSSTTMTEVDGSKRPVTQVVKNNQYVLPKHLSMEGEMKVESRFRSLYEVLLYGTDLNLKGEFSFTDLKDIEVPQGSSLQRLKPYLVVIIKDSRGLTTIPLLTWNDKTIPVKAGLNGLNPNAGGGFYIDLPEEMRNGGIHSFTIAMSLRGTQSFGWIPVGEETKVKIHSNWAHPSFQGTGLPKAHDIRADGFHAEWESTHFSTNITQFLAEEMSIKAFEKREVGIKLVQPVDIYQQTERSVKYGFLIIALTFAAFLGFETVKQLSIHPIQYTFVGLALVIFYVLLLALSEHITFAKAYVLASVASISLLGFYIRYIVHSWKHTLSFTISLALLNAATYGIMISEDYALLYGSILLFGLLAAAMIGTRRVDWNKTQIAGAIKVED